MHKLTPASGDCKRCRTPLCTCRVSRRRTSGTARTSNVPEGIEHVRRMGERGKPRWQWGFRPDDGDVVGKQATRAERKALRNRWLQERPHDGKSDQFPRK